MKINNKNTRKRREISPKLTKNLIQMSIHHPLRKVILVVVMLIVMLICKYLWQVNTTETL